MVARALLLYVVSKMFLAHFYAVDGVFSMVFKRFLTSQKKQTFMILWR